MYEWIDLYCLEQTGAIHDYKAEWEAHRYLVGGKMFAMVGADKAGLAILSLKAEPLEGELLRSRYPDIVPGYYMNKTHWISIYLKGAVPEEVMRERIEASYRLVRDGLPKKVRASLEQQAPV